MGAPRRSPHQSELPRNRDNPPAITLWILRNLRPRPDHDVGTTMAQADAVNPHCRNSSTSVFLSPTPSLGLVSHRQNVPLRCTPHRRSLHQVRSRNTFWNCYTYCKADASCDANGVVDIGELQSSIRYSIASVFSIQRIICVCVQKN